MIKISPSMLSCDFARLGEETKAVSAGGADMIHLDVMDGCFVPNITIGAPVIKAMRPYSDKIFDVHLMIQNPLQYIEDFAGSGADLITFHQESASDIKQTIDKIHACGCKAGLSIKPGTPAERVFPYLAELDMVLVMTVEPGFGGQSFMPDMLEKVAEIRRESDILGRKTDIQVDGGISPETIVSAAKAGANVFVAGSFIFSAGDIAEKIQQLRTLAEEA